MYGRDKMCLNGKKLKEGKEKRIWHLGSQAGFLCENTRPT